jgi:hypothetical protein
MVVHQKSIAISTLKMSKIGASIAGGMNHKQAISFLLENGYTEKALKTCLTKNGHSETDIQEFFSK